MGTGESISGATPAYGLGRVLLAGNDADGRSIVQTCLASAGYEAEVCEPRRVLVAFQRTLPDLVVISPGLARPHTLAVCTWIRARASTPLIVISSSAALDPVDALTCGADLVLPPSVGDSELVARVRGLLRRSPPRRTALQPEVGFSGISLDREAGRLRLPGGVLQLDGRELDLMEALVLGGSKLTDRQSLRKALGEDDSGLDRLVRRLRERLESVDGWRRIVAVRGVGFRLLQRPPVGEGPAIAEPRIIDLREGEPEQSVQCGPASPDASTRTASSAEG